ncbi:MAG: hypothetical protein KGO02_11450 [Alphaproteobacteria bacterium]|nr:hypothetical protein [Alphaproteobacteria bacterium]
MSQAFRFVPVETLGLKPRIGVAALAKRAFDGEDLNPLWGELVTRLRADNADVDAAMDLSVIAQLLGHPELGKQLQSEALAVRPLYRSPSASKKPRLRLLAFAAATDMGGNTPLEFLLEGSDIELYTYYVVPGGVQPELLPDHDAAFVAVPDSDETRQTLHEIQRLTFGWPRPLLNLPRRIRELERDRLFKLLDGIPGIQIPATTRVDRDDLTDVLDGACALSDLGVELNFPLIIRPVGSQAGRGLERVENIEDLRAYLQDGTHADFFVSQFIDYSGEDGLFRKYRIVFIDGQPFACHMAIADLWKLWYLNAGMDHSELKRAEEAAFMSNFSDGIGGRHERTLNTIARRVGLDYFAIDCAETKDGKLLIFEADIAMIVHNMDPPEVFPYKGPQMKAVFAAFVAMIETHVRKAEAA